jgi:hypothetical protein
MKLDQAQKAMMAVISVFENGKPNTYGQTYWEPNTKELSGGLLMASTLSGNMHKLLTVYQNAGGKLIDFTFIHVLAANDPTKLSDADRDTFRAQFKKAGSDPVMQQAQLDFFSDQFLAKAESRAETLGLTEPLARLVILDSTVQGGFATVLKLMPTKYEGTDTPLNQWDFTKIYIQTRMNWLATSSNTLLHRTVDRLQSVQAIVDSNNWKLETPIHLPTKGYTITDADLG